MDTLLRSVQIIDPNSNYNGQKKDILFNDVEILKIEDRIKKTIKCKVIEASNLCFTPTFFDSQVSFGEPGFEERETLLNGLNTALKSGFGDVCMLPNTQPIIDQASMIHFIKHKTLEHPVSLYPMGCLTAKRKGEHMAELFDMHSSGCIAFSDDDSPIQNPNVLKIALQYVQSFNGLIFSFPKNVQLARNSQVNESEATTRLGLKAAPPIAESIQIARDIHILSYTGGKLHIPLVTTEASVQLIREAKNKSLQISCSTAIHHVFFTDEKLEEFDTKFKVEPPLRSEHDRLALIEGIKDGTIDMLTSDHRPIQIENKKVEFDQAAYGSIGLESLFSASNSLLGLELTIEKMTQGRKVFGIKTPVVEVGQKLNFNLIDPTINFIFSTNDIFSSSKNSIFLNENLKGKVIDTFISK